MNDDHEHSTKALSGHNIPAEDNHEHEQTLYSDNSTEYDICHCSILYENAGCCPSDCKHHRVFNTCDLQEQTEV